MSHKFICPVCRKSYKGNAFTNTGRRYCCGYRLIHLGYKARPPKPHQKKKWREFVKKFVVPVYRYWIEEDEETRRSIYALWANLDMKDEFLEMLKKTEEIYWKAVEKKREDLYWREIGNFIRSL